MKRRKLLVALSIFIILQGVIFGLLGRGKAPGPKMRVIHIKARKYSYDPPIIRVNRGDEITLTLESEDVTHGFYIEGYDIDAKVRPETPHFWLRHPSKGDDYETVEEIRFVADKNGKFRYRCSITCGTFHPFMQGELVVEPNYAYPVSIGLVLGLAIACVVYFKSKKD
ncbi:MAG: hypothetical protein NG740_03330 [Omnitrophica bacterium]|nr:hypothetical protein [Candidatus Omnitrophota bacterium]